MRPFTARILSAALAILLCCTPELLLAMTGQEPASKQVSSAQTNSTQGSTSAPANPVPDAPSAAQTTAPAQPNAPAQKSAQSDQQQPAQPEGTAAARAARTIGGPASKPAGSAIAPAKQRQMRSLLIKVGAIVAAGATLGTVYALTRGTPSKPPGAH